MKIQLKITFLFTLLCLSVIVLLSVAIYYFANENAFQDFYTRLELRAVIASKMNFEANEQSLETYENLREQHLQRLEAEKEYIIRTDTLERIKNSSLYKITGRAFFREIENNGKASLRHQFQFFEGMVHKTPGNTYYIVVSAVNSYAQNFLISLRKILVAVCIFSTIVVFSIGILFSRQVLAPIRNIAQRVNNISVTSLHERLEIRDGKDEISILAATFNDMLSRLETAFETQNNFVSNASHELNTPLTAIIGEADFALARPRNAEDYERSLRVIMSEAEKLQGLTRGLLELAQSSFSGNLRYEEVNVDELVHNSLQIARNVYPACPVSLDRSLGPEGKSEFRIQGNAQLFELAISNVLLNACKYSMEKGVNLAIALSSTHIFFMISDSGIGIPQKEIKHIFDPFFRASNAKGIRGYGIGLPLARNIILLYKGTIEINSLENAGTEVVIRFPL
ncbi:sensor histidine kinase [Flavitalea flava]